MRLTIDIQSDRAWSYASAGTKRPIVRSVTVHQDGVLPDRDIRIVPRITLDFPLPEQVAEVWTSANPRVVEARGSRVGESVTWERIDLKVNYPLLGRLQEKVRGAIRVEIVDLDSEAVLATASQEFDLLAPNEFRQEADYLETIAAFVLPSDPYVAEILAEAREILHTRTGSSATEGYQSDDHDPKAPYRGVEQSRAFQIAHAVYDAMSSMGYDYSNPPGYFDNAQKVRTPAQIKQENCATCLDSTVLMAACLAQAGLEPVIFLTRGHAFAGFFSGRPLDPNSSKASGEGAVNVLLKVIQSNSSQAQLLRGRDDALIQELLGARHIIPIETTTTTRSMPRDFISACQRQNGFSVVPDPLTGTDTSELEGIVVVRLARLSGIMPPPVLNASAGGVAVSDDGSPLDRPLEEVDIDEPVELEDLAKLTPEERAIPPRVRQWMASLLDLSTSNPLLKVKTAQMMEFDLPPRILGGLDDMLFTPKKRIKIPAFSTLPATWIINGVTDDMFEEWSGAELSLVYPSYKEANSIHRRVESTVREIKSDATHPGHNLSEAELVRQVREILLKQLDDQLAKTAKKLLDKSAEVMLNKGSSGMYLALGTLAWEESDTTGRGKASKKSFCAPLYLYPVVLDGGKGRPWTIRLDSSGEVTPNFCLYEKLKRSGIDLRELITPAEDDKGLDLEGMLKAIKKRLADAKMDNFAVQPRAILGVFDYATFRLWKDLRDDWEKMTGISPVFKHLAYTANTLYTGNPPVPPTRLEPLLPIAADDSQKRAVQMALDGQSFRLEGPPGTGKSQTITNLLASCIAHNLKVLFVAEKQTALHAVKDRLDKTGLGKFSLNLHAKGDSDTKLRKNIKEALTDVLKQQIDPADQKWEEISARLKNEERLLDRYRDSLHDAGTDGFSAWGANEQLLELGPGETIALPPNFVRDFGTVWPEVREAIFALENALDLVPDPGRHIWRFTGSLNLETINLASLTTTLTTLTEVAVGIQRDDPRAAGLLTPRLLGVLRLVFQLRTEGLLSDLTVLHDVSGAVPHSLAVESAKLIEEARSLHDDLAPHCSIVSPEILGHVGRDALATFRWVPVDSEQESRLAKLEEEWKEIARTVASLPGRVEFRRLAPDESAEARRILESMDDSSDKKSLNEIVDALRALQAEIRQHETNIAAHFLARTDMPNITLLMNDAKEAGALTRSKRMRALRDSLGSSALATDDRLLMLSLEAMIGFAKDASTLVLRLQSQFGDLVPEDFRPWFAQDVNMLNGLFESSRVKVLRDKGYLSPAPKNDSTYCTALKSILDLGPQVDDAIIRTAEMLPPGSPVEQLKPWQPGAFTWVREAIEAAWLLDVRAILGPHLLVADPRAGARAAEALLGLAGRMDGLQAALQTTVLKGSAREFRPWILGDIEAVSQSLDRLTNLLSTLKAGDVEFIRSALEGPAGTRLVEVLTPLSEAWSKLAEMFGARNVADWMGERPFIEFLSQEVTRLVIDAGNHNNYIELHRWQTLRAAIDRLTHLGLESALPAVLAGDTTTMELLSCVRRSALAQSLRQRMEEGNLDRFDPKVHERRIKAFEMALADARKVLGRRIPGLAVKRLLERQLPSGAQRGATQDLLRGLDPKRGEKVPIRILIDAYGSALADHMPCFLMSPDSVASLLPVGAIDFDLVVFDEASQVRTAHAVGALGRGRAGIVVGDSRQMPPSTTFSSNQGTEVKDDDEDHDFENYLESTDEEDDEESVLVPMSARDAESILKEFDESDLPALQLLCHYRSKDEVLISFSNTYIYDEPMLTFPSPLGLDSTSLRFVHLPDGRFERDKQAPPHQIGNGAVVLPSHRTNIREAQEIVAEVLRRLRDPRRTARRTADKEREAESIIVVTFNVPQMALITEMLRAADPDLVEAALTSESSDDESERTFEPRLKIRNVENVQGDEAETVIFSVAFSKKPDGKLPKQFGPVTKTGGDRRLNVAVTRAKREMIVYCSFLPEDIGQPGQMSHETSMLQQFLRLAQRGPASSGDIGVAVPRSRQIEAIAADLREMGFEAQTQLGLSTLRVDIALRRPGKPNWEYAIMVDDVCWATRGSAYQREVLPRQVLPSMGWKAVYRIWLPAWMNARAEIMQDMQKLLDGVDEPEEVEDDVVETTAIAPPSPQTSADDDTQAPMVSDGASTLPVVPQGNQFEVFTPFMGTGVGGQSTIYDWPTNPAARTRVLEVIDAVLAAEAPIEVKRFSRIVYRAFDFSRVNQDRVERMLDLVQSDQITTDAVGRFVWLTPRQWETWTGYRTSHAPAPRTVDEIPVIEWANALTDFVKRSRSMRHDDAVRELGLSFGIQRLTTQIRGVIETAIADAVSSNRVILVDGAYRLP